MSRQIVNAREGSIRDRSVSRPCARRSHHASPPDSMNEWVGELYETGLNWCAARLAMGVIRNDIRNP
jgi:hypothetical protein